MATNRFGDNGFVLAPAGQASHSLLMSDHADRRAAQRGFMTGDIEFIMQFGRRFFRRKGVCHFLAGRDIPASLQRQYGRLAGATVIVSLDHRPTVITLYKNPRAIRSLKRAGSQ